VRVTVNRSVLLNTGDGDDRVVAQGVSAGVDAIFVGGAGFDTFVDAGVIIDGEFEDALGGGLSRAGGPGRGRTTAPVRGCVPWCKLISILSKAMAYMEKAASKILSGSPVNVKTVRLAARLLSRCSNFTPGVLSITSAMAFIISSFLPSLILGTHSTVLRFILQVCLYYFIL
jgi:hypothetical protein